MAVRSAAPGSKSRMHFARDSYIKKIVQNGLMPVFVSALMTREMVNELYAECSGALFMGGGDFDAKYYGTKNHRRNDRSEPERDALELYLLKKILKDKKPFLGICRGCQALAIASGGSLHQHIPDITKEKHNVKSYDELASNNFHAINVEEGSQVGRILGTGTLKVNTGHHQAVRATGPEFRIVARTRSGIVEAIEYRDKKYFCLGIQCHPEMMPRGPVDKLFVAFAGAVIRYKGRT